MPQRRSCPCLSPLSACTAAPLWPLRKIRAGPLWPLRATAGRRRGARGRRRCGDGAAAAPGLLVDPFSCVAGRWCCAGAGAGACGMGAAAWGRSTQRASGGTRRKTLAAQPPARWRPCACRGASTRHCIASPLPGRPGRRSGGAGAQRHGPAAPFRYRSTCSAPPQIVAGGLQPAGRLRRLLLAGAGRCWLLQGSAGCPPAGACATTAWAAAGAPGNVAAEPEHWDGCCARAGAGCCTDLGACRPQKGRVGSRMPMARTGRQRAAAGGQMPRGMQARRPRWRCSSSWASGRGGAIHPWQKSVKCRLGAWWAWQVAPGSGPPPDRGATAAGGRGNRSRHPGALGGWGHPLLAFITCRGTVSQRISTVWWRHGACTCNWFVFIARDRRVYTGAGGRGSEAKRGGGPWARGYRPCWAARRAWHNAEQNNSSRLKVRV